MNGEPKISRRQFLGLSLIAMGIVYGDIGTSPLYAFRLCFHETMGVRVTTGNILGLLSLIVWSLFILITLKYLTLVLRADNRGEGGVLALLALVRHDAQQSGWGQKVLIVLALFGAALLYGDGLITPAISVLSAVEGVNVATSVFKPWVVPIALAVLVGLFLVQRRGTQVVGSVFGPVMILWFLVIALLGLRQILHGPGVLAALNPWYAIHFFVANRWQGFIALGSVFLVLTGGETLYADMGHFGRNPIRCGWYTVVLPALLLNYLGQGAWLLDHQSLAATENLFYRIAPGWALYPLVALATLATVIASQAVISGVSSMTRQAVQLGYSPRLMIVHTSHQTIGQVYLPLVNWWMLVGTVLLVLGFGQSDRLGGAYGVAVAGTMLITTMLLITVMVRHWQWRWPLALALLLPIMVLDLAFFGSNLLKLREGGWVPVAIGVATCILMTTWSKGRQLVGRDFVEFGISVADFIQEVVTHPPLRVPGVAVFLTGNPGNTPRTLLHNFKHNKILHEQIVLLSVQNEEIPHVPAAERVAVEVLDQGFMRVIVRYGFSEDPDLPAVLRQLAEKYPELDPLRVTYFLGRETLIVTAQRTMQMWRKRLFVFLSRNAHDASRFFRLPANRVVELGVQVEF